MYSWTSCNETVAILDTPVPRTGESLNRRMEGNFNYDLFETEWIGEYSTRFYYKKIHNNRFVKEKLDCIIKDKFDSNLERDYLNIYVRKTWNVQE